MGKLDIGVTGGSPTLLGSLTAAARLLPENADWQAHGTSHVPENCGFAWPWQPCTSAPFVEGSDCVNEVQQLQIVDAEGGTFTLTFDTQTTSPIAYGATAGAVQAALEALSNVAPGDIVVTGGPDTYTFTYGGQYACTNVPQITADCTELTGPDPGAAPVDLLTADTYGVLAGSTVTNVPTSPTVITGDLGLDPGSAVTGFPLGVVTGFTNVNNAAAIQAKADLVTAYNDAAGRTTDFLLAPDIGGSTLPPGVYTTDGTPASLGITGTVTLDAAGDPNAVWIFQIESTLITAPGAVVALINGAQACNVFWQVGSSATLDTTTDFAGSILALASITANTGATVDGRLLARNAAVTLDDNQITVPSCTIAPPPNAPSCLTTTSIQGAAITADSGTDKPLNPGADAVEFKPFLVEYNAQDCGGIPGDWEQLSDRAKRGLAVRAGNAIDLALSSSAPDGSPNDSPSLPTTATDITGAAPASIVNTISGLIQEAYACGATGELFIHLPAWALPHLLNLELVTQLGNVFKLGPHTVVVDQGFANEAPTGSPAAGVGEAWIYVSGPIEYATGSIQILDDTTRGVSPRLNRANVIAAQLAIYRFDPCCIYAALAEVC